MPPIDRALVLPSSSEEIPTVALARLIADAEPMASPSHVDVQVSAPQELAQILYWIAQSVQAGQPLELGPRIRVSPSLASRVAGFWADGVRGFDEMLVLARWSGTYFDTDPSGLFGRVPEVLKVISLHEIGLASERPDVRAIIEHRLRRLAQEDELRASYLELIDTVWQVVAAEWMTNGLADALRECAAWRARLAAGRSLVSLLPPDHVVFQLGFIPLLEAGLAKREVVVIPGHFALRGNIIDLSGLIGVGVRTGPAATANEPMKRGRRIAQALRVVGTPLRAAILSVLADAPATVAEIADAVEKSPRSVGAHVRALAAAAMIEADTTITPTRFRVIEGSIDRVLNDVSQWLGRGQGRAPALQSRALSVGASFRAIFEHAPIAIIQLDLRGRCVACNPETERILGYSEADIGQLRGVHLLADEADSDVFELTDKAAAVAGRSDVRLRRKDGSLFWGSITVSQVGDTNGHARFSYVMLEDLSDRRGAEDFVTGLPNRVLFLAQFERLVALSRRTGDRVGLLMLDLDGFKKVNDTFGHEVGDTLLRQVGMRLVSRLRGGDTIARLGGDEFGILLMGSSSLASTTALALALRREVLEPYIIDGHAIRVGASFGIALGAAATKPVSALMAEADEAMYVAKRTGSGYQVAGTDVALR